MPVSALASTIGLTTPVSRPYNLFVNERDCTLDVPWDSLSVEMTGTVQTVAAEFDLVDTSNSISEIADLCSVRYEDNLSGTQGFVGSLVSRTPAISGLGRVIHCRAVDLGTALDISLIPYEERPTESDQARLAYLLSVYGDLLNANRQAIALTNAAMPKATFANMTLRSAIETVCSNASATTRYWIDPLGRLATASTFVTPAPYRIVVGQPGAGETAPESLDIEYNSTAVINAYYVQGANAAGSGWVTDAASIAQYGRREAYMQAPDADTGPKRDAVGNAALTDTKDVIAEGSFVVSSPYDGWLPGQTVTVTSAFHNLSAASYRILSVTKTYFSGVGDRRYVVKFSGTGRKPLIQMRGQMLQTMPNQLNSGKLGALTVRPFDQSRPSAPVWSLIPGGF